MRYYAVYDSKTDRLLASGTSAECRKQLGLASVKSFYSLVSNVRGGKNKKYDILVEDVDDSEG